MKWIAVEEAYVAIPVLRVEQGLSFQAIADELNRLDHRTRTGKAWNKSQAKRLVDRASIQPSENVVSSQS